VEFHGRSEQLPPLRAVFASLGPLGGLLANAREIRVIIDTNIVLGVLLFHAKKRISTARTALEEVIASGTAIVFAPESVREEVEEKLPVLARDKGIPIEMLSQTWAQLAAMLHFASPPLPEFQGRPEIHQLAQRDPDDLPLVGLADAVGAAAILSRDKHLSDTLGTGDATMQILFDLREYGRSKVIELQLKAGGGIVVISLSEAGIAFGKGLVALTRLLVRAPWWLQALLLGGAAITFLHPRTRGTFLGGITKAGAFVADVADAVMPIFAQVSAELTRAEASAARAWNAASNHMPCPPRVFLRQIVYAVCLAAERPLTVADIRAKALAHGYAPRGPGHDRYLRRVLRSDPRLEEGGDHRWTLRRGHPSAAGRPTRSRRAS